MQRTLVGQPCDPREQLQTISVLPLCVCIGKVYSDIALTQRTEDRVSDRVQEYVSIGMTVAAAIGSLVAILQDCTIRVERAPDTPAEPSTEPGPTRVA